MNKSVILAGMLLACVMLAQVGAAAEDVTGAWEFRSQWPSWTMHATMTISRGADGKYSGMWSMEWGESTLSDISFENGSLRFVQTADFAGQDFKTTYECKVEGNNLTGKGKNQFGESKVEGTLEGEPKSGAEAICGEWQLTVTTAAREIVEKMTITKTADGALAGKWEGQFGENMISNVKLDGGKLTFTRTTKFGDQEFTSTFGGTVDGDKIKGVFESERGEREVSAARITAAKPEAGKAEPNMPPADKPKEKKPS